MEKLTLIIKSDSPITLSIPNPSDELKQHAFDTIMSKVTISSLITMEGLPIRPLHACACHDEVASTVELTTDEPFEGTITLNDEVEKDSTAAIVQKAIDVLKDDPGEKKDSRWEEVDVEVSPFNATQKEENFAELLEQDLAKRAYKKAEQEEDKSFYETGIKTKGGKNAYKCRYECTNTTCGLKANQYIWEGTQEVECHSCGNRLKVKKATPGEALDRDPFGNFYVAGKRKPYHEINTY